MQYKGILKDKICNIKEIWSKIQYEKDDTKAKFSI